MYIFNGESLETVEQIRGFLKLIMDCYLLDTDILVVALVYLDRLVLRCDEDAFGVTPANLKLLLLVSLALSAKYIDDRFETNTIFNAAVGI